jgi:hypothetical protein
VRRVALALAAAIALAGLVAVADAKPRKPRKHRRALHGRVTAAHAGVPRGLRAPTNPAGGGTRTPGRPTPTPTPAPLPGDPGAPPPPPPVPGGSGHSLQARTNDADPAHLRLLLSATTALAGDVKIEFNNHFAEDPHDLVVERVDGTGPSYSFDELDPGAVQTRTVALDAGSWRLRCTIPTHADRGMKATLAVT